MKTWMVFTPLGLLAALSVTLADPLWSRTYNGPYDSYDEVHAIGVDDSGNVVVSGFSELSRNDEEFVTIKYRPDGDTAWLRHFNPGSGLDGATALAVDRSGNVIVTGYLGGSTSEYGDWMTIKYSAAGESLWAAVLDRGGEDRPSALVVDSAGNSYVTGRAGSLNYLDFTAVKYGPGGDEVWVFNYDGGDNDGANAVAVDAQGNTYLTGYTIRSGNYGDLMTWKLGLGGESLWASVYAGPAGRHDVGTAIAVDGSGNVIAAGFSNDSANRSDYIVIKYAPNGDTVWSRRYNGPGNLQDYVAGLASDDAGNAYVTGISNADDNHYNYATIKYGPDGTERWIARYAGVTGRAQATAVVLDADANVYVTGSSADSSGGWDVVTVKYDSAGNQRWVERYDRPSTYDEAYVLALSRHGNVYVGGRTDIENNGIDYLTLAYGVVGAIQETMNDERETMHRLTGAAAANAGPTIVRGVLRLRDCHPVCAGQTGGCTQPALLDAAGRRVLDLHLGANGVSHLAPGVYFVRSEPTAASRRPSAVARVVVTR